jgi:serine/threonine protein kinase
MTEAPLTHPGDEALRALSLSQLAEAELAHVSAHLGDCPACCRRIDQLATDDHLLARLQHDAASREKVLVAPAQRRLAVRALRHSHEARSATRKRDREAGTVPEIANASAVQTHREGPPSRGLPDEPTRFLAPPERPDEIGRLGPYRILAVLARGGMGVVFRAHDPALDRSVALKAMLPGEAAVPNARERFLREARAAAALKHPHVVTIFQVGEDRGAPFLAMEFLEGEPLDACIRREGRLPLAEVLRIGRETALALAAAHARGLVHRDVKPANLWLESVGDSLCESQPTRGASGLPSVKVLDFGLALVAADPAHLTQSGLVVGTPAYMAPEQAEGKPVDPRCDLFSLGCVLYQMCTGTLPFHGETTIAVLRALALHEPPPVGELRPEAPPELSALVARLLAKKPEDRPASAQEVAQALRALEQFPTTQVLPKPKARPARKSRKPLVAVAGAALALVLVLALGLVLWPTPHGTVRIESDDPAVEVVFGKDGPTIKGADKEPVTLRPGEHGVLIKRGDFTFEADKLVLKKGAALTLKVELLRGKVQVLQDGQVVATQDLPAPPPGANRGDPLAGWRREVAALPAEEQVRAVAAKLKDLNPGFDGQVTHTIEGGVVTHFAFLTDHVTRITSLRALTSLTTLDCPGSTWDKGQLADLSPLRGMRLTHLNCWANKVADLSPLAGMKLTFLDCSNTAVTTLEPLRGMALEDLNCRQSWGIQSLAPLQGMPLKRLDCSRTGVSDLAPLRGMKLNFLALTTTQVADLSPLRGMKLTTLSCKEAKVTDLSVLRGMPLKVLWCDFRAERDTAILRSLEALETINEKSAAEFWKEVDTKP